MTAGLKQTPEMRAAILRQGLDDALDRIASRLEALAAGAEPAPFEAPEGSALVPLGRIFGLDAGEQELVALAAGQELSPRIGAALAALTSTGTVDAEFCTRLLGPGTWDMLCPGAPLRRWRLVEPAGGGPLRRRPIRIDERILHYLLGTTYVDARLEGLVRPLPRTGAAEGPIHALAERIGTAWTTADRPPVLMIGGRDRAGKRQAAAAAMGGLGVLLFALRAADLPADWAQREALAVLLDRELALSGGAVLIEADEGQAREAARIADMIGAPTILSAADPETPDRMPRLRLDLDPPTAPARHDMWRRTLGRGADAIGRDLDRLAAQFSLDPAGIEAAAAEAQDPTGPPQELGARLWDAARRQGRRALDGLADRLESRASWDDLVLPADQIEVLHDLAGHLREQWTVNQDWGWEARGARGLGASALFAGPSGTGKTLAAEVLAGELALDLYRIDLSQVVSKYIGETEKNLSRIFDAAEQGGAILLFDEADALFGKRSEVKDSHDRYANVEVSYLLQRMEAYRGLAILTTNQKSALDTAFLRRLRYVLTFPFPDADARSEIWRRIFPAGTPCRRLDAVALGRLNLAGGSIRSIALNAAYLAAADGGAVTMGHVLRAARREYSKLEKPFTAAEMGAFR
jgi:vesicle-fusing ATPase